jgi:hypothetical protein
MNWEYVDRELTRRLPNGIEPVRHYANAADRMLQNLIHYRRGGQHEEDDVVTAAIELAKMSGEDAI